MTNAANTHAPRTDMNLTYAVLAAGTLIAIAIVVTALVAPRAGLVPNPQGGLWVERGGTLYLCQARPKAPAPCVNLVDGSNVLYGDISH